MDIQADLFIDSILRWGHIFAAAIWMGFALFFLFVAPPGRLPIDVARRSLWWMYMASTKTVALGLALFYWSFMHLKVGVGTGRTRYIMYGMMLGLVMWLLLVFVIRPALKQILDARAADIQPPASAVKRAELFGRINGYLSGPMLLMMVFAHNYATFSYAILGMLTVIGVSCIWGCLFWSKWLNRRLGS